MKQKSIVKSVEDDIINKNNKKGKIIMSNTLYLGIVAFSLIFYLTSNFLKKKQIKQIIKASKEGDDELDDYDFVSVPASVIECFSLLLLFTIFINILNFH